MASIYENLAVPSTLGKQLINAGALGATPGGLLGSLASQFGGGLGGAFGSTVESALDIGAGGLGGGLGSALGSLAVPFGAFLPILMGLFGMGGHAHPTASSLQSEASEARSARGRLRDALINQQPADISTIGQAGFGLPSLPGMGGQLNYYTPPSEAKGLASGEGGGYGAGIFSPYDWQVENMAKSGQPFDPNKIFFPNQTFEMSGTDQSGFSGIGTGQKVTFPQTQYNTDRYNLMFSPEKLALMNRSRPAQEEQNNPFWYLNDINRGESD